MVAQPRTTGLLSLPNEILISILNRFPTLSLLPLAPTSRCIHSLVLRILRHRLLIASSLPDHQLIFECYHPSVRMSTPYFLCEYLGTSLLNPRASITSASILASDDCDEREHPKRLSLGEMNSLYTSFRPYLPQSNSITAPRTHPAGGLILPFNSNLSPTPNISSTSIADTPAPSLVTQTLHLESHELFSQLCTLTNVVKLGPKRGLFLTCVDVGEGTVRVWRNWLADRSASCGEVRRVETLENYIQSGQENGKGSDGILWADRDEHVGLRVNARELSGDAPPITSAVRREEDEAVSYELEYDELLVRTSHLLLKVEQSIDQELNHPGKATVFGSWDR